MLDNSNHSMDLFARLAAAHEEIAHLRDEVAGLKTAMESRAAIEQAKGMIMAQRQCDVEQAFRVMVEASQRSNRKVRDIAELIVAGCSNNQPVPKFGKTSAA